MSNTDIQVTEDDDGNFVFMGTICKRHVKDLDLEEHIEKIFQINDSVLMLILLVRILGTLTDRLAKDALAEMKKGAN